MARSNGVGYPPEKGLRVCIPGLSTKIEVRKALRFPALVQKLKTEICKKKSSERSPAAVRFLQLAREDQKRHPIPTFPRNEDGLSPEDILRAENSERLCVLMLGTNDDMREGDLALKRAIEKYQNWDDGAATKKTGATLALRDALREL
jgi:hypothetical protein